MPPKKKTTNRKTPARKPRKKKVAREVVTKSSMDWMDLWQPLGGVGPGGYYDSFQSLPAPGPLELIGAFSDTVFSCATLIAPALASIEVKLVVEQTGDPLRSPHSRISSRGISRRYRTKGAELAEIHAHPALDLLHRPNPEMSWNDLIHQTDIWQEVVGWCYWLVTDTDDGLPGRIDIIPPHLLKRVYDDDGNLIGYKRTDSKAGEGDYDYTPDRIIPFAHYEFLANGDGVSPARAVWQKIQLSHKELSSWEVIVSQMAVPLVSLSPKDPDAPWSPDSAEKLAKEFTARFWRQGQGGPLVNTEAMDITPLSWPPRDQAGLALQDVLKSAICNAYHVPRPLLDMQDANFASASTARQSFQLFCLKPRITYLLERISRCLLSRFDERLFLVAEEFVERDEQLEIQKRQTAISAYQAGLTLKNEARADLGLDPVAGGNTFYQPPAPASPFGLAFAPPSTKAADPAGKYDAYPLKPVVEVIRKWAGVMRDAALAKTNAKAWIDLGEYRNDMAADLYPAVRLTYDRAGRGMATRLSLSDQVWEVVQQGIGEAAKSAALRLAESTIRTTTLELDEARSRLRDELAGGLEAGEYVGQLVERVKSVFDSLSDARAWLIADTERTRAIGSAETIVARAAGVKGKAWLADAMACPECASLDGVAVPVDQPYVIDPSAGPYAVVPFPPRHPGCRCSQRFIVGE